MTIPPKRILIVDDNEVVLETIREFLSEAYTVDGATSASMALESLRKNPPDLILLDVRMPGVDGLTLLGVLRRLGLTLPVIVMTGYDSTETAAEATRHRATDYLVKPVDLRELDRIIADALGVPRLLSA
jgi:DNA-binding NtrC family response regulator